METEEKPREPEQPRNAVVRAKEHLYSRVNVSVRQVDIFIALCVAAIAIVVAFGIAMG